MEVFRDGVWGTVTGDNFDDVDAQAVCRGLEYSGAAAWEGCCSKYGQGTVPILMDNVACNGSEASIIDCHSDPPDSNDDHSDDYGVRCQGEMQTFC